MSIDRLHVFISGRVQGVAFRYCTCEEAERLGLSGWVRNLYDGRVEAEFEGSRDRLDMMLDWCGHGPRGADVTQVESAWTAGPPQYAAFHIRH